MTMLIATEEGVETLVQGADDAPLIAVIPGDDVALHRLHLIETDPTPRLEEARMRATDLAARPLDELHIAVGPTDAEGASWIAIMDRERMAGHLAHFDAAGVKPAHLLPAALLLEPEPDGPALARFHDRVLIKTGEVAGLIEPALASPLAGVSQLGRMARMSAFGPDAIPDPLPLDMLQGLFAPRRKWWKERRFRLWAALLTALALLLLIAPALVDRARTAATVAAHDRAVVELAAATLGSRPTDAEAGAAALAQARRAAEGGALAARLTAVAQAVEQTPGARLDSARLAGGELQLVLGGSADAINAVGPKLAAGAFTAKADGTSLTLGDRRAGIATTDTPLSRSMLRLVSARSDAALVAAAKARGGRMQPQAVAAAFIAAGLSQPGSSGPIQVAAARSTVLLPLLADLEMKGANFTAASLSRNADETLSASFTAAP
ncbi:type II secretion system protein GspL [Sandaracinobacteroides hominis]|uniref:type II secretion system protein GspL n=1 Tax=Sandaracinobacteroides hominis TaxID=2780086 RepID=UPI0018F68272|nr:type II secretion system protein GspL [Sandaracinobacteroides hominis]